MSSATVVDGALMDNLHLSLGKFSRRQDKLMLFPPENRLWHLVQCMECQNLFSRENNNKKIKMSSAVVLFTQHTKH